MRTKAYQIGAQAEVWAADYLDLHNLKLIARNFHSRYGEIDLIMLDGDCLSFIEVRARQYSNFGCALESVQPAKQHKIIKTAQSFLQKHPEYENFDCRFDVVAIDYQRTLNLSQKILDLLQEQTVNLQWIKHAYTM